MSQAVAAPGMTGEQMVALCRQHSLYEWSAQGAVDPIPVARAKGIHFWTPEDKRYIDFNSQLMCVNAGHGHPKIIKAIQDQAATLAYTNPFMASEARARLGAKLAEITPGDLEVFFFTNGGAEANENAIRLARAVTGRHKILARYRSYHGGTAGPMGLTAHSTWKFNTPQGFGVHHAVLPDRYRGPIGYDDARAGEKYAADVVDLIRTGTPGKVAGFIAEQNLADAVAGRKAMSQRTAEFAGSQDGDERHREVGGPEPAAYSSRGSWAARPRPGVAARCLRPSVEASRGPLPAWSPR